jgi:hypothetical protein
VIASRLTGRSVKLRASNWVMSVWVMPLMTMTSNASSRWPGPRLTATSLRVAGPAQLPGP